MADTVEVYRDAGDDWRWRRRSTNGHITATSGEGYTNRTHAEHMARTLNPDAKLTSPE